MNEKELTITEVNSLLTANILRACAIVGAARATLGDDRHATAVMKHHPELVTAVFEEIMSYEVYAQVPNKTDASALPVTSPAGEPATADADPLAKPSTAYDGI